MCYMLYLSTSSREDLSRYNSDLINFQRLDRADNEYLTGLNNREKWYVGSKSGCSCTFRHLLSVELGFGRPQEWYPEGEDELKATAELYRVIARLIYSGKKVDCLDIWYGAELESIRTRTVDLLEVAEKEFRLFENHHFVFKLSSPSRPKR